MAAPYFMEGLCAEGEAGLAIYHAGPVVDAGDDLGIVELSGADVLEREFIVVDELRSRGWPMVMLTSAPFTPSASKGGSAQQVMSAGAMSARTSTLFIASVIFSTNMSRHLRHGAA